MTRKKSRSSSSRASSHHKSSKTFEPPPLRPATIGGNSGSGAPLSSSSTGVAPATSSTSTLKTPNSAPSRRRRRTKSSSLVRTPPPSPRSMRSTTDADDESSFSSNALESVDDAHFYRHWRRGGRIGRGAFGAVYMGLNVDSGALFAEKVIELEWLEDDVVREFDEARVAAPVLEARREIDLMRALAHENIVQYLGTKLEARELSIYLEFVSGGSILALLKKFGAFPLRLVCNYTRQTLAGLDYLHTRSVIHRDIKSANLLVTERGIVKLADFGCSKSTLSTLSIGGRSRAPVAPAVAVNGGAAAAGAAGAAGASGAGASTAGGGGGEFNETALKGTPNFMAPEAITKALFHPASDIWSLGCTVLEMAHGSAPFSAGRDENIATVLFRIASLKAPPRAQYPAAATKPIVQLLDYCFAIEPNLRATAAALIEFLNDDVVDSIPETT